MKNTRTTFVETWEENGHAYFKRVSRLDALVDVMCGYEVRLVGGEQPLLNQVHWQLMGDSPWDKEYYLKTIVDGFAIRLYYDNANFTWVIELQNGSIYPLTLQGERILEEITDLDTWRKLYWSKN